MFNIKTLIAFSLICVLSGCASINTSTLFSDHTNEAPQDWQSRLDDPEYIPGQTMDQMLVNLDMAQCLKSSPAVQSLLSKDVSEFRALGYIGEGEVDGKSVLQIRYKASYIQNDTKASVSLPFPAIMSAFVSHGEFLLAPDASDTPSDLCQAGRQVATYLDDLVATPS